MKNSYKKFVAASVTAGLVASIAAPVMAAEGDFTDFPEGQDGYEEVMALTDMGWINGYPDGTFKPYQNITRGQAAKIIARVLELEVPEDRAVFTDVPVNAKDQELVDAVAAVYEAGIMTGKANGKFDPSAPLSRQQMAKVLVETFDLDLYLNEISEVEFTDENEIHPSQLPYVEILEDLEIAQGNKGEFNPLEGTKRKQFAQFLSRTLDVVYKPVKAISALEDIEASGSEDLELPEVVEVTFEDESKGIVPVYWDTTDIDFDKQGEYNLTGGIDGSDDTIIVKVIIDTIPAVVTNGIVDSEKVKAIDIKFNDELDATKQNRMAHDLVVVDSKGNTLLPVTDYQTVANGSVLSIVGLKDNETYTVKSKSTVSEITDKTGNLAKAFTTGITIQVNVDTEKELKEAIVKGGTHSLGSDLTLSTELTIDNTVTILGNNHKLDHGVQILADNVVIDGLSITPSGFWVTDEGTPDEFDWHYGVLIGDVNGVVVKNSTIAGPAGKDAIGISDITGNTNASFTAENNTISNGWLGIMVDSANTKATMKNNKISDEKHGIFITTAAVSEQTITGNLLKDPKILSDGTTKGTGINLPSAATAEEMAALKSGNTFENVDDANKVATH